MASDLSAMVAPARGRRSGSPIGRTLLPYAFVLPPLLYLCVFMFGPLARQVWMSLTNTRVINPNGGTFIGTRNFVRLFNDPAFYSTLSITVDLRHPVGRLRRLPRPRLGARHRPALPGRALARAVLLFGWAVPGVAAALIWLWMYNGQSGVFNAMLAAAGFEPVPWLTSTATALPAILVVTVWQVAPFVMLVVLAALQSVPEEVREAARIDGADSLNVFRHVTLPHILPSVQLVALLVAVWSIRRFDIIYLLTGGGPLNSTSTLVVKIRQTAFENYELGLASAYGVVGLVLALLVAAVHRVAEQRRNRLMAR